MLDVIMGKRGALPFSKLLPVTFLVYYNIFYVTTLQHQKLDVLCISLGISEDVLFRSERAVKGL